MMRFAVLLLVSTLLHADMIHWMGSFDTALEKARRDRKPMLIVVVRHGCSQCRELFATTFRDNEIVQLVNNKTVPVIVTKENEDYPIELLYTLEYPTLFLLSPEENFLAEPIKGAADASLLKEKLLNER
jgi:thioredoxin-related protein